TVTNKAAREMLESVNKRGHKTRTTAHGTKNSERRTPNSEIPSRPTICTFHSLCVRILRQHIEKLGYQRNFVIYDESDQLGVIRKSSAAFPRKAKRLIRRPYSPRLAGNGMAVRSRRWVSRV